MRRPRQPQPGLLTKRNVMILLGFTFVLYLVYLSNVLGSGSRPGKAKEVHLDRDDKQGNTKRHANDDYDDDDMESDEDEDGDQHMVRSTRKRKSKKDVDDDEEDAQDTGDSKGEETPKKKVVHDEDDDEDDEEEPTDKKKKTSSTSHDDEEEEQEDQGDQGSVTQDGIALNNKAYFRNTGNKDEDDDEEVTDNSYTFYSNDFHISPIADLKDIFGELSQKVIDKSFSGHCHLKGTCAQGVKVINRDNGITLHPNPCGTRREFFEAYKNDAEMKSVDAFVCNHPSAMCELFMPFNKSLIVYATTRFEMGRHAPEYWKAWVENVRRIAKNPRNIIAANNLYDAEYVKYFTGLKDVVVIPNYCGYTNVNYNPTRPEILIGPSHSDGGLMNELKAKGGSDFQFKHIRELYPHYEYKDLAAHPAIVNLPYQVSVMSFFEYYRMSIPLFFPSLDLLARWHTDRAILKERTWDRVYGKPKAKSDIERHPESDIPYDPNNEFDFDAIKYWVKYSDFYQWPHIQLFDSWDDLIEKLKSANLKKISAAMAKHNIEAKEDLKNLWRKLFKRMFHGQKPGTREIPSGDFNGAMKELYDTSVPASC